MSFCGLGSGFWSLANPDRTRTKLAAIPPAVLRKRRLRSPLSTAASRDSHFSHITRSPCRPDTSKQFPETVLWHLPDHSNQPGSDPSMTLGGEVDAVNLHHSRRPDRIDDPVRLDRPDASPVKFAQDLRHIGLPHFGADHSAAMLAPLEIVPAEIQDHKPGAVRHRTVETRKLPSSCVSAYSGVGDMNVAAPGVEHALQHLGPGFRWADAFALGIAGAKGNDLRRGGICGGDTEDDERQHQQPRPDDVHGFFLALSASNRKVAAATRLAQRQNPDASRGYRDAGMLVPIKTRHRPTPVPDLIGDDRAIQHAAASRFNHCRLWN